LKLHLVDEPGRALRALTVKLAAQPLDLQLEVGDHRLGGRCGGLELQRLGVKAAGCIPGKRRRRFCLDAGLALRQDHRMRRSQIGWQRRRGR
jgi:hypothetical protein